MNLPPRSQQALSAEVLQRGSHELEAIWLDYLANGGGATLAEFQAHLQGNLEMPHFERRALEHTLWELRHLCTKTDACPACCDGALDSIRSTGRLAAAPSPDLLVSLVGGSTRWRPAARTVVGAAVALIKKAARERLDRIGTRPPWRHRRYVGW